MSEGARSYGGQTGPQRTAERRARLLEATIALLAEQGESRTTMTAICTRAGLTERYFYESFANREAALHAALDAICDEIGALAVEAVATSPGGPAERVAAALTAIVDLMVADPAKGRVVVLESTATPALRARRQELIGSFAQLVAGEAALLYGADAWPPERAHLHGLVFVAGFTELVACWLNGALDLTPESLVATTGPIFPAIMRRAVG